MDPGVQSRERNVPSFARMISSESAVDTGRSSQEPATSSSSCRSAIGSGTESRGPRGDDDTPRGRAERHDDRVEAVIITAHGPNH